MSESINQVDTHSGYGVTEHSFKKVLPGEIAHVRQRLIDALEKFEYMILSEEPLHARRGGSFSMNILNCDLKLTIALRQSSEVSTIATFNYVIPLSMVTSGDLHTLEREAEAIIALVNMRPTSSTCVMCGTNNSGDSRFCRGCGAPNAGSVPAELEVMRLTAGARAGQQTVVTGAIVVLSILAIAVPLILFGRPKGVTAGWVLLILGQLVGWATLLYGMIRLHRTLNPKTTAQPFPSMNHAQAFTPAKAGALPPQSAWASVTEGTTELLGTQPGERVEAPAARTNADTGAMKEEVL